MLQLVLCPRIALLGALLASIGCTDVAEPSQDPSGGGGKADDPNPTQGAAPTGDGIWIRHDKGSATASLQSLAVDTDGSVVAVGHFSKSINFGSGALASRGSTEGFVVKYDAAGTPKWARSFGGCGADQVVGVAIAGDHSVYVFGSAAFTNAACDPMFAGARIPTSFATGQASSVLVLAQYDANGTERWARAYGPAGAQLVAYGLALRGDVVAMTASNDKAVDFGGGATVSQSTHKLVAIAATADGTGKWARGFGVGARAFPGIVLDDGQVIVAGNFTSAVDVGAAAQLGFGSGDVVLAAFDLGNGAYRWHQQLGGLDDDQTTGITRAADGSIWLTGYFHGDANFGGSLLTPAGGYDGFAAQFAATGQPIQSLASGVSANDMFRGGAAYDDGGLVIVGDEFSLTPSAVVTRIDPGGTPLWRHVVGTKASVAVGVGVAPSGEIAIGGTFSNTLTIPPLPSVTSSGSNQGFSDAYIARLAP